MTDLVERLRDPPVNSATARDAADEIERLRNDRDDSDRASEEREAEIERLRGALKRVLADIAEYERINNLAPNPGRQYCWDSVAQAHAVLDIQHTTDKHDG